MVTDLDAGRLHFAKEFVPSCSTYQINTALGPEENAKAIRQLFMPSFASDGGAQLQAEYYAPRTVLECTGVESSVCTAAYAARRGGTVCVIGVGKPVMNNFPFMHLSLAEVGIWLP